MTCFWSGFWEKLDFGGSFGVFWVANLDLVLRVGVVLGWVDGKIFEFWFFEVGDKNFWVVRLLRVVILWGGSLVLWRRMGEMGWSIWVFFWSWGWGWKGLGWMFA
jgi:hypothetical protein